MNQQSKGKSIFCILLLLPLVFIVYLAIVYSSNRIDSSDIRLITLNMPGKEPIEIKSGDDIDFFVNAIMDASEISQPLRPLNESESVKLLCDRADKVLEYTLYPELSLTGCMLDKNDGKLYVLDNNTAKALLSRTEFEYLYESRFTQPLLLTSGDTVTQVMPTVYEWKYRRLAGDYVSYTESDIYDGVTVYSIYADKTNNLGFQIPPQTLSIELSDESGTPIPESSITNLIFANDTIINIKVTAEWNHNSDSLFFGKATYSFRALYDVPSTLTLSANTVEAGSAIAVNVRHLNENENVSVTTDLSVSPLAFSENSGYKTALLAIDTEAQPGEYQLTFTIGGSTFTETLTVTEPTRDFHRLSISTADYERLLGEPAVNELKAMIQTLNGEISATAYTDPSLPLRVPTDTGTLDVGYGSQILMNLDGGTDSKAYYAIGNSYKCVDGAKVTAAAAGKVVYSGMSLMLGNVVVVDHGCGLQTWYYGLKSSERAVGAELKAGDVVGFAGTSDYVSDYRIGFAASVCGMFTKLTFN